MATSNSLPIQNVINISVANPPTGLASYAVNNLLYATKETPVNGGLLDYTVYLTPTQVGIDWGLSSETYQAALAVFSQQPNILTGGGAFIVAAMAGGDTLTTIYNKIAPEIYFGGMLFGGYQPNDAEMIAGAATFQAAGILLFLASNDPTELTTGHAFFSVQAAGQQYARCLLYTVGALQARLFAAAYASLGMSTNWAGSNTASTQQMKNLAGILPDPGITQTTLTLCQTIGVDIYANFGPLPKLFSTGGNTFFDQVWGILWLAGSLQVAGFNAIATTSTKIPQTEAGIAQLRNAYTKILEQAVTAGFVAPGAWNSPVLFGNPDTLVKSVANLGYYVYSQPVAQQAQTARVARQAPLIQIAVKLAGAVHSSSVIVYINP
jgi:hypothetical protein